MRIALLSETYSKDMGYATSALSKAFARLGADVHLLVADLPPYYNLPDFAKTYGSFSGLKREHAEVETIDGYTVHYLPHKKILGYTRMTGLLEELRSLRPDVVQAMTAIGWIPLDAAVSRALLDFSLFTETHTHASVFPLAKKKASLLDPEFLRNMLTRAACGRLVSLFSEKCYGTAVDCADVGVRFFGVQRRKMALSPLGVDTSVFFPVRDASSERSRAEIRKKFGFSPSEVVCVYSGRFSEEKNPLLLAKAVARLRSSGQEVRGLFVGEGAQKEAIKASDGCVVNPFVPFTDLGQYFRAADIGAWPAQESMSMLDCAACGLPIVVNDTLQAVERVDGNGATYKLHDAEDLARVLASLLAAPARERLGGHGAKKMAELYSWDTIARSRLRDYEAALARNRPRG